METSYLLIAFLMMIALPFLISKLGSAGRDDGQFGSKEL